MVYTDDMVYTVDMVYTAYMVNTDQAETPFGKWLSHAGVQEYFQIDCHTRVSRSIF